MFPPREEMLLPTLMAHAGSILILPFRIDSDGSAWPCTWMCRFRMAVAILWDFIDIHSPGSVGATHSLANWGGREERRAPLYLPEVMEKSQKEKKLL